MNLTREQFEAVRRKDQDVCVVAGPGSGKTRVLTERFRWLVEEGVSPLRILAVTFTEKAANELKQRLARDFLHDPFRREQIERAPVSTIDSFCAGLLREHAIESGLDPTFKVLDAADAWAELWDASEQALDELFAEEREGVRALLGALDLPDAVEALVRVHQAMRITATGAAAGAAVRLRAGEAAFSDLVESLRRIAAADPSNGNEKQQRALEGVQDWARQALEIASAPLSHDHFRILGEFHVNLNHLKKGNPVYEEVKAVKSTLLDAARQALVAEYYAPQRVLLWRAVERIDEAYRHRKEILNALDFADLEEHAIRLLRDRDEVRRRVRANFDAILIDELQDINPLQASLLELVRRPDRFFAVGDVNQSIYGFRHAAPETFRRFRDALESAGRPVDRLHKNFRSRTEILWATEAVLHRADGIESQALEARRQFSLDRDDPSVELIAAIGATAEEAARIEARRVAQRIGELEGSLVIEEKDTGVVRPAAFSDIVILVRNVNALPEFEQALHRRGIPYLVGRGKHFYEAREITDLVHLLRVVVNPRDEISMAAVLRSPLVGASNEALYRLKLCGNLGVVLNRLEYFDMSACNAADLERLRAFQELLRELRAFADDLSPDRIVARAIDRAGYDASLGGRARGNVDKLLGRLRDWHENRPRPLLAVVHQLEFLRASDPDEPSAPPEEASNAVRILTVHAAKGLEFPIVFLAAMHKGVSGDSPALAFSPETGLVARWLDPYSHEPVKDLAYTIFAESLRRKQDEEENRLLYVAMTRAEERLVLSFAHNGKGEPRNWAGKLAASLSLDLSQASNAPVVCRPPVPDPERGFSVRLLCVDTAPEAAAAYGGTGGFACSPVVFTPRSRWTGETACPTPVTDQYDSSASVTSISLFDSCPRRYYLARYLGWQGDKSSPGLPRDVADRSIDAGELGREVHDLLAGVALPNPSAQALELVARFKTSELGRLAEQTPHPEREFEFVMVVEDVVVEGRIDLWFEEANELVLIDYKTDNVDADEAGARAAEYALQMQLYALALERAAGRLPDRACLHFLRPNVVVPVKIDGEGLETAREAVRRFRQAQNAIRFPKREGDQCHRCAFYRGLCP